VNKWKQALELVLGAPTQNTYRETPLAYRWFVTDKRGRSYEVFGDTEQDAIVSVCTYHGISDRGLKVEKVG